MLKGIDLLSSNLTTILVIQCDSVDKLSIADVLMKYMSSMVRIKLININKHYEWLKTYTD